VSIDGLLYVVPIKTRSVAFGSGLYMVDSLLSVIGGFGDYETPSECWGVKLIGEFDGRDEAHNFAEIQYEGYRNENWGTDEDPQSYFVLVVDSVDLVKWGLVK